MTRALPDTGAREDREAAVTRSHYVDDCSRDDKECDSSRQAAEDSEEVYGSPLGTAA